MNELEQAHLDYELRKNEIITKLICIRDSSEVSNEIMRIWLDQAINFIQEREI